ncbi:YbjN domain-containing protein [Pararobbsia alpina]|uniref:YbjN domain-containing protein n=1 Tax=Pararobbsia alpina TaxID=621374 RepID=A0A6S7BRX8_9BURK|nr:YbjN domain-containing protein [Pararobbsia alpina]CAB3797490.1 hypothetical protein LMG28138_04256 [Pararobbsia alpina]
MTPVWKEEEVSIEVLSEHLSNSGFVVQGVEDNQISLRTGAGIGYSVTLHDSPQFIRLSTYLPLRSDEPTAKKRELEHRLNASIFLATFTLDDDEDVTVTYVMPYGHGLIAGQFAAIVQRFGSLLDFVVHTQNESGLIDFEESRTPPTANLLN